MKPSCTNIWSGMPNRLEVSRGTTPNRWRSRPVNWSRAVKAQSKATNPSSQTNARIRAIRSADSGLRRNDGAGASRDSRSPPKRSLSSPFMSSMAVLTILTLLSGSSTQRTGISRTLYPFFSHRMRSSVSKNHPVSLTRGSTCSTIRRLTALNPHWASTNLVRNMLLKMRL